VNVSDVLEDGTRVWLTTGNYKNFPIATEPTKKYKRSEMHVHEIKIFLSGYRWNRQKKKISLSVAEFSVGTENFLSASR